MSKRTLKCFAEGLTVTSYLDYRSYLQDLYERAKAATSPYSYLHFAEDLGFSPTNMIRLVIARKRLLADKSAATIVKTLSLRKTDRRYFLAMVKHSNARGPHSREKHFAEMLEAKQEAIAASPDSQRMIFFSEWYYPVVREMLRLETGSKDPAALSARLYPSVSAEKIKAAIELVAAVTDAGPILLPEDATAGELAITQYHQAMLDVAKESVVKVPHADRDFNAVTLSVSAKTFQKIRELARAFCAAGMALESEPQPREHAIQLNLQLFKLTKPE